MGYLEDIDNDEHPRNAAAIRTAIMLGAEFYQPCPDSPTGSGQWSIKGINHICNNKCIAAWLFLATHGIGIDKDAKPVNLRDVGKEGHYDVNGDKGL